MKWKFITLVIVALVFMTGVVCAAIYYTDSFGQIEKNFEVPVILNIPEVSFKSEEILEQKEEETPDELPVILSSFILAQGDTLVVKVKSEKKPVVEFNGKTFDFFEIRQGEWFALLGVDAKAKPGKFPILVEFEEGEKFSQNLEIKKQNWPITKLVINEDLADQGYTPETIAQNIVDENKAINQAVSTYQDSPYFKEKFMDPLLLRSIVGAFGNIRENGETSLQHLGVDLDGSIGDPVRAINDGVVVLAQSGFPNYGTTVIIDHGLGIFSLYLHLSELKVVLGDRIKKGEVVGLVGNTGYSLEPHLHFSLKIRGANLNPLKFIDTFNTAF